MIDYRGLADGDPGGTLQDAFNIMETATVSEAEDRSFNYTQIANQAGFGVATELQAVVTMLVGANQFPAWVNSALESEGINVNDPQVSGAVTSLVAAGLSQESADAILALRYVENKVYPRIKIGYLANARQKRIDGEI